MALSYHHTPQLYGCVSRQKVLPSLLLIQANIFQKRKCLEAEVTWKLYSVAKGTSHQIHLKHEQNHLKLAWHLDHHHTLRQLNKQISKQCLLTGNK